jgi:hypothetical protein
VKPISSPAAKRAQFGEVIDRSSNQARGAGTRVRWGRSLIRVLVFLLD